MESSLNKHTKTWVSSNIYEFIDPDTLVHYLVYQMRGITPRLNADGTIMIGINED